MQRSINEIRILFNEINFNGNRKSASAQRAVLPKEAAEKMLSLGLNRRSFVFFYSKIKAKSLIFGEKRYIEHIS